MTRVVSRSERKGQLAHRNSKLSMVGGVRSILLKAASRGEKVTYGTLMRTFGLSRGKALTRMISAVDYQEYASHAPGFAALVVRKDTGYPGGGYFCDSTLSPKLRRLPSRATDPRLSAAEESRVKRKQREIWRYYTKTRPSRRR